jgi:hypothetical protein
VCNLINTDPAIEATLFLRGTLGKLNYMAKIEDTDLQIFMKSITRIKVIGLLFLLIMLIFAMFIKDSPPKVKTTPAASSLEVKDK